MKPAKNLLELENNLNPAENLTQEEKAFYVPIYEKQSKFLRHKILNSQHEKDTFYIAGQSGTGKTTALQFLPDKEILKRFDVAFISFKDLVELGDVDIIDILLLFAFEVIQLNKDLSDLYFNELDKLYKKSIGALQEIAETTTAKASEIKAGSKTFLGINFSFIKQGFELFGSYKFNNEKRKVLRETFDPRKDELLKLINRIIDQYYRINNMQKSLLAIFDNLEKIKDQSRIRSIFIENKLIIEEIGCKKIIAIPVHLPTISPTINDRSKLQYFTIKIASNPLSISHEPSEEEEIRKNRDDLKEIYRRRVVAAKTLVNDEALELAISFSGGIIRQFIKLLNNAVTEVNVYGSSNALVSRYDVEKALLDERRSLSRAVVGDERILMLKKVMDTHTPQGTELFVEVLLDNQIIAYPNQDTWYDVNPLIKETVNVYSKPLLNG